MPNKTDDTDYLFDPDAVEEYDASQNATISHESDFSLDDYLFDPDAPSEPENALDGLSSEIDDNLFTKDEDGNLKPYRPELPYDAEIEDPSKPNRTDRFFMPEDEKDLEDKLSDHALAQGLGAGVAVATGGAYNPATVAVLNEAHNRLIDTAYDVKDGKNVAEALGDNFDLDKDDELRARNEAIDKDRIEDAVIEAVGDSHAPVGDRQTAEQVRQSAMIPNTVTKSGTATTQIVVQKIDSRTQPEDFAQPNDPKEERARAEKHPLTEQPKLELTENEKIQRQTMLNACHTQSGTDAVNALFNNLTLQQREALAKIPIEANRAQVKAIDTTPKGEQARNR